MHNSCSTASARSPARRCLPCWSNSRAGACTVVVPCTPLWLRPRCFVASMHPEAAVASGRGLLQAGQSCAGVGCVALSLIAVGLSILCAALIAVKHFLDVWRYRRALRAGSVPSGMVVHYCECCRCRRPTPSSLSGTAMRYNTCLSAALRRRHACSPCDIPLVRRDDPRERAGRSFQKCVCRPTSGEQGRAQGGGLPHLHVGHKLEEVAGVLVRPRHVQALLQGTGDAAEAARGVPALPPAAGGGRGQSRRPSEASSAIRNNF